MNTKKSLDTNKMVNKDMQKMLRHPLASTGLFLVVAAIAMLGLWQQKPREVMKHDDDDELQWGRVIAYSLLIAAATNGLVYSMVAYA